jgi:galacturonosyltransferase
MKIMMIGVTSTGLYSVRKEVIDTLVKEHQITLVAQDSERVEYFKSIGCEFVATDFDNHGTNPREEVKFFGFYWNVIKRINPDLVLTYAIKPNIYAGMCCAIRKIPYIANITGLGMAVETPGKMQKLLIRLYRLGLKKANYVFFQNKSNMKFCLENGMVSSKYGLIPGSGVNIKKFHVLAYPKSDTIEFAFISRVMTEKGIDQYLEAAKVIHKKYKNTVFHVCGGCEPKYEELLFKLDSEGVIEYHGRVSEIISIYSRIHCTVHPSYYPEGLSNVLLESSACARPIITTGRPGCGEVIEDGVNGFLILEKDSTDLINKIEKFILLPQNVKEQMGLNGRKKVESEFDRNIVIRAYESEIAKALSQKGMNNGL